MIKINIDHRSSEPIYLQITEQVRRMVANGELKAGDQLPTVRQLAADLRINFNTVARAYRLLDEARLISTQKGRGTYIWEAPAPETLQQLRQEGLNGLTRRYLAEAARANYAPDDVRASFERCLQLWEQNGALDEHSSAFPEE